MTRGSHRLLLLPLVALVLRAASFSGLVGRDHLHEYSFLALAALSGNEAILYATVAFVQTLFVVGLGAWLARAWSERADRATRGLLDKRTAGLALLAAIGGGLSLLCAFTIVHLHTITEDEKTYLFQSKLLLLGKLSAPAPPAIAALREPFLVDADGRWTGQYFWAQPALVALGLLAHATYLVPAIEVACTVFFTGLLAQELTKDRRVAFLAAGVVCTSPLVILTGATLLNDNLSAACAAITLWSLARLRRKSDIGASLALGLATAINLHNRPLDQAALVAAAAGVLLVAPASDRDRVALARRIAPAVALSAPLLALHPVLNAAISGDWSHSGYWLANEGHGWTTMGFGRGPSGFRQDGTIASAKTIANGVRMAFYLAGGPLVFVPAAACFVAGVAWELLRTALWIAFVYFAAYFVYASASIATTGPVYFDALVPVLAGAVAVGATRVHDALRDHPIFSRLIPGLAVAQLTAALLFFWPPALAELRRAAKDSAACDDLGATLDPAQPALVFVADGESPVSGTFWQPMPSPGADDRILFARSGGIGVDSTTAAQVGGERALYFARCVATADPRIERYDPARGRSAPARAERGPRE